LSLKELLYSEHYSHSSRYYLQAVGIVIALGPTADGTVIGCTVTAEVGRGLGPTADGTVIGCTVTAEVGRGLGPTADGTVIGCTVTAEVGRGLGPTTDDTVMGGQAAIPCC
jgi:hypothetical protein